MTDNAWEPEGMPPPMWSNRDPQSATESVIKPWPVPEQHYLTAITLMPSGTAYLLACYCGWLAQAPAVRVGGSWESHKKGRPIEHD